MNYITTNIRLAEEDYFRLKSEAAKQRKSLSALIREKVNASSAPTQKNIKKMIADLDAVALNNSKKVKEVNSASVIRKIRNSAKW